MSAPQHGGQPGQAAAAQPRTLGGSLSKTPVPRLLMSASSARVTGTLELTGEGGESATIVMARGLVTKVKTSAPVAYLGAVLYELGYIDTDVLNDSLRELSRMKWLHGEILLTRGALTPAQLAEGLHEQTTRKLFHLFTLPTTTTYSFEAEVDRLSSWGGTDWPHVDPSIAVWRGVRQGFAAEDIEAAFARQAKNAFRLATAADPKKFDMSDAEVFAAECMRGRALTLDELAGHGGMEPRRTRELVYFLVVTKQAESLDTSGVRPAYRPPAEATASAAEAASPAAPALARPLTPIGAIPVSGTPYTKPTVREMAAVGSAPRIPIASDGLAPRDPTESARWRAVAPIAGQSSAKMPVAVAYAESGKQPIARSATPSASSTVPPRITMGGVEPVPPGSRRLTPPALPATHAGPPPLPAATRPSTGAFNARVVAELASRRKSIFERARAVLKEDYFQRLSLPRDAQPTQVEEAFAALQTLWDPAFLPPGLEEAKDDCAFVMSCLVEAYSTLRSPPAREAYAREMTLSALRAPADMLAEDLAASGAADAFEGAAACFARGDVERAERLARRANKANPEAGGALALLAWIEANKPANASPEETKKRIVMLDRALRADETMEHAYYWRGMLHKRIDNHNAAMTSFRRVVELNPKNIDAVRELRVYEMRIRRNSITMKAVK